MRMNLFCLLALAGLLPMVAPMAHADLLLDVGNGGVASACGMACGDNGITEGWTFTANDAITITGIGILQINGHPFSSPLEAGLWDSGGNLLASVSVTNSSTPVASAGGEQWLFESITPVTLVAGDTYTVANIVYNDDDPVYESDPPFTVDPDITFGTGVGSAVNAGFVFPQGSNSYPSFGANLETSTPPVPEPGSASLLGLGIAALALFAARRARIC